MRRRERGFGPPHGHRGDFPISEPPKPGGFLILNFTPLVRIGRLPFAVDWQVKLTAIDNFAGFDDQVDILGVIDVDQRIGIQKNQIGQLAFLYRALLAFFAEETGSIEGADSDHIERRDACFDKPLQFAVTGWVSGLVGFQNDDAAGLRDPPKVFFGDRSHDLHRVADPRRQCHG